MNEKKFEVAKQLGCTSCVNPKDHPDKPMQQVLVGMSPTGFGYDHTFDCTGNVEVMRTALEAAHRGWGHMTIIGVAAAGKEIATRPFQFVTGRKCTGTAFGGWKTRDAIPMLVERSLKGEIALDHFVTHNCAREAAEGERTVAAREPRLRASRACARHDRMRYCTRQALGRSSPSVLTIVLPPSPCPPLPRSQGSGRNDAGARGPPLWRLPPRSRAVLSTACAVLLTGRPRRSRLADDALCLHAHTRQVRSVGASRAPQKDHRDHSDVCGHRR